MIADETISDEQRKTFEKELLSWKTPQVKSCFEPIVMAQKPRIGTFYENWKKYHVGLINIENLSGEAKKVTSNVMTTEFLAETLDKTFLVGKPTRKEKGETTHLSVKPLSLMQHLATVVVPENGIILDPFSGSGSTGIAAISSKRKYIGFEKNSDYFEQSKTRFEKIFTITSEENSFMINEQNNAVLF